MIPKLRAWDKEDERMRTVSSINFAHEVISCKFAELKPFDLVDEFSIDDVILMQSTGLKDKNGTEVYEGDIVKCSRGCPHAIYWEKELGGSYIGGMPAWYLSGLREGYAWTGTEEIIGNIYENPELLEGAAI